MEELRKFQSSIFDTIARQRLVEDQNAIMELSGRVQELQNEVNCMNDSKDFRILNQYAVEIPTFPTDQCHSHLVQYLKGMLRPSSKQLGHTWYIGKRFCRSVCVIKSIQSSRIESMELVTRGAAPFIHSGRKVKGQNKIKI